MSTVMAVTLLVVSVIAWALVVAWALRSSEAAKATRSTPAGTRELRCTEETELRRALSMAEAARGDRL